MNRGLYLGSRGRVRSHSNIGSESHGLITSYQIKTLSPCMRGDFMSSTGALAEYRVLYKKDSQKSSIDGKLCSATAACEDPKWLKFGKFCKLTMLSHRYNTSNLRL